MSNLDHIRSYYDALNTGDAELVASHFTVDAVHYYTRLGPHEGAERIGQNAKLGVGAIDGQWFIEHGIEQGDEAVIEWTMTWRDPKSGEKRPLAAVLDDGHCASPSAPSAAFRFASSGGGFQSSSIV